jgi:hypothetical protein
MESADKYGTQEIGNDRVNAKETLISPLAFIFFLLS